MYLLEAFICFMFQACLLKFASWSYDNQFMYVDNKSISGDTGFFVENGEWDLLGIPLIRHNIKYVCCVLPFSDVTFWVIIRRKPLYYVFNLVIPSFFLMGTTFMTFYLPVESGEKVSLGVTVLLAITVFLLLVAETMPSQSLSIPLLGKNSSMHYILKGVITIVNTNDCNIIQ